MATLENKENATNNTRFRNKLSLKGNKQSKLSDISPAPVPRSSHRIRSSNTECEDKQKLNANKKQLGSSLLTATNALLDQENVVMNGISNIGRANGICPLANLGNTCFLNSVLYALRFLPGFIHDLHHMYTYLQSSESEKTSAISQRVTFLSELHNVFVSLNKEEESSTDTRRVPALHPLQFLESVRMVNPLFEGNHQQDAHELLHCLLDQLCSLPQDHLKMVHKSKDPEFHKSPRAKRKCRSEKESYLDAETLDIVGSKFMGRMRLETCCIECEQTNSQEENFLEVCVPVKRKMSVDDDEEVTDSDVLLNALCEEESLIESNKYWCEFCCHLNEARRSVHYPQLPHHLLIHVKRFSSYSRTFATKCCDAMPAPLQLPCFCQKCRFREKLMQKNRVEDAFGVRGRKRKLPPSSNENVTSHLPYYLTAFVCHLGATISSGHYVSYVRLNSNFQSRCLSKDVGGSGSSASSSLKDLNCSFFDCCASHLEKNMTFRCLNGHSDLNSSSIPVDCLWLECDDEKIKVLSSSDAVDVMKSNRLTPYLLFYSR